MIKKIRNIKYVLVILICLGFFSYSNAITVKNSETINSTVSTTDPDGDSITYTKNTSPNHGDLSVNSDGSYTYDPSSTYYGPDSFEIKASDGNGNYGIITVNVDVIDEIGVTTCSQLQDISDAINQGGTTTYPNNGQVYKLKNNIDCSGISNFQSIGTSGYAFQGIFKGKGYTISNINNDCNSSNACGGLFGNIDNSSITNLSLENINLSNGGSEYYGGLAGRVENTDIKEVGINNSSIDVSSSNSNYVGGLIGFNRKGKSNNESVIIEKSYVSNSIIKGSWYVGGFIGKNHKSIIKNSLITKSEVYGDVCVGGLLGSFNSNSNIKDIYADTNKNDKYGGCKSVKDKANLSWFTSQGDWDNNIDGSVSLSNDSNNKEYPIPDSDNLIQVFFEKNNGTGMSLGGGMTTVPKSYYK